jgi:hypothetical protein
VLAISRPPTPSEAAAADDSAASDALRAQDTFDSERARLNEQLLRELGKVALGYEAQSTVQLRVAQADHDAEATAIATNLAQGKYGDATSQLAQTRAQQLQQANDDLLKERQAAIALDSYVKTLQAQDASNERAAQYQVDDLQARESIAQTIKERRDLELKIIDLQFDEKKKHLEYLKALADLAGNTAEAARIQDEINRLPKEKAHAQQGANDNNKSPFEAYRDSLPTLGQAGETPKPRRRRPEAAQRRAGRCASEIEELQGTGRRRHARVRHRHRIFRRRRPGSASMAPNWSPAARQQGPHRRRQPPHGGRQRQRPDDRQPDVTIQRDFRGADPRRSRDQPAHGPAGTELPGMIVATMNDARDRFVWRGR